MRKTLASILAAFSLGLPGCLDRIPPEKDKEVIRMPPLEIVVENEPKYSTEIEGVLQENQIDREAFKDLYQGIRFVQGLIYYNGDLGLIRGSPGGTAFVYKNEEDKICLSTANHVLGEATLYFATWNWREVPQNKNDTINSLTDQQRKDLFFKQDRLMAIYKIKENISDDFPDDDVLLQVGATNKDLDSAILYTDEESENIPYSKELKVGNAELISNDNTYIIGFDRGKELIFKKCGNAEPDDNVAACYVQPGMSGGLYLVYKDDKFYIVGQVTAMVRDMNSSFADAPIEKMIYTPIEKLEAFLKMKQE